MYGILICEIYMLIFIICNMKLYSKDYVNIYGFMICLDCKINIFENVLILLCMIIFDK